jgi:hypothetical protein
MGILSSRLPSRTFVYGSYFKPLLHFFINTQYFLGFVQVTKSLYRVLLYTLLCFYARVTIFTSFPPPLGSMSRGSPLINSLIRILGRFITLQANVS